MDILKERYEIQDILGQGGFGKIYLAKDRLTDMEVTVKELKRNPSSSDKLYERILSSFNIERKCLKKINGIPGLPEYVDSFSEDDTEYLVQKMIPGISLSQYVRNTEANIPANQMIALIKDLIWSIYRIHQLGFLHRDISPGNLILDEDGKLHLIDFGAVTSMNDKELESTQFFDHAGFDAPEHDDLTKIGPHSDVYSLCCTIVYLVTGQPVNLPGERRFHDNLSDILVRSGFSLREQKALTHGLKLDIKSRTGDMLTFLNELTGDNRKFYGYDKVWDVKYGVRTDIGNRNDNQDSYVLDTLLISNGKNSEKKGEFTCEPKKLYIAAVCDGVGGASHGELASSETVKKIEEFLLNYSDENGLPEKQFKSLCKELNQTIVNLCKKVGTTATTLALFAWYEGNYYAVNVGDSPIYLLRQGKLKQLSTNHTRAAELIAAGKVPTLHDYNVLTGYLGNKDAEEKLGSIYCGCMQPGDTFLICSDGVSKPLEEEQLKRFLGKRPDKGLAELKKYLKHKQNKDNNTCIILAFE